MADTGGSQVLDQRITTAWQPSGRFEQVWEITFRTPSGVIGHVDVPRGQYNADNVAKVIKAETEHIEAVHQLGK